MLGRRILDLLDKDIELKIIALFIVILYLINIKGKREISSLRKMRPYLVPNEYTLS